MIDLVERILFPLDGYPAPTPPDPTPDETVIMRNKLEKRIDEMIPGKSSTGTNGASTDEQVSPVRPCSQVAPHLYSMLYRRPNVMPILSRWYWILLWLLLYRNWSSRVGRKIM